MTFLTGVALLAFVAGAIAAISGFGIGSLLTPLLAWQLGTRTAVPLVALPHLVATSLRLWMLRKDVDLRVLWSFGIVSAAAGLVGALLYTYLDSPILAVVLGVLLIFAGLAGVTGFAERFRIRGPGAWIAGALSGALGGLVGNQGGIRSAALLGFDLSKQSFVATATAIALLVDGARTPIYLIHGWDELGKHWQVVVAAAIGVVLGTIAGERLLRWIPDHVFRRVVSASILAIGVAVLVIRR